ALVQAQCQPFNSLSFRSPVTAASGLTATPIFGNLTTPRGVAFDADGNLLVVERGLGVTAFTDRDSTCDGWLRTVVIANTSFTQGIAVDGPKLYVSTSGAVLRYVYDTSTRTVNGFPEVVVDGIPPDGELTTRPILLHPAKNPNTLIVSSALSENIDSTARDPSSGRSQLRLFPLPSSSSVVPIDFFNGTLLAFGIRNPAGFAFLPDITSSKKLWVVDNGASIDNVTGLTAAFVNDNPADELNFVDLTGSDSSSSAPFYGFPDCTTLWNPDADPAGDPQFTSFHTGEQFSLDLEPERDDAWCQDPANNVPPRISFQAHSVPLDLKFFRPTSDASTASLPKSWKGDAFVSFHGSFDRTPPTGYAVVRVPFAGASPVASPTSTEGYEILVQAANLTSCPGTCIKPVGLAFASDGRLFVSSDSSGELFTLSSNA
ncbi:soluble quino protein glucose dehydrogenase, partial [Punctularia strigosozonata HHB-11173 SS5]|uniref:soluble quino protein glucose dehydrogenase n=1 Tax=Punctularia strigosozonata (strain HHB-11173) TaxID=741275 RepID=UPI0004416DC4